MKLTQEFSEVRNNEVVNVSETVKLSDSEAETVMVEMINNNFCLSCSEVAKWEKLKERGTVIERSEESTGAVF